MRIRLKSSKVISVSADGGILSRSVRLPLNTINVKAVKEPYKVEDRQQYKNFSKSIAKKVAQFRQNVAENEKLKKLVNRNSIKTVATMFDKLIEINKDE